MDRSVLYLMDEQQWLPTVAVKVEIETALRDPLFSKRLVLLALSLMRGKTFRGRPVRDRFDPSDFIHTAIEKALAGERRMRKGEAGGVLAFLASCIRSEISNTVTCRESGILEAGVITTDSASLGVSATVDLGVEQHLLAEEERRVILKIFKNDRQMQAIAQLAMDGASGRMTFAAALNTTADEVTNIKKKMQRIYSAHLSELSGGRSRYV